MLCTFLDPGEDEKWAERATQLNAAQVKAWARAVRRRRREEAARAQGERFLHAWWDAGGDFLRVGPASSRGPSAPPCGERSTRICDQLGPGPHGVFAPREQRMADALVELAAARIAADDPDRASVVVHVEARELSRIHGKAWLEDGPDVPSEVARRLACDARVEVVAREGNGAPVGIGRISRIVPPKLMRQLRERDGGCVLCGRTVGLHAHHRIHWAHGAARTWTIWSSCADVVTGSSTTAGSGSSVIASDGRGSSGPTDASSRADRLHSGPTSATEPSVRAVDGALPCAAELGESRREH